MVMESQKHPVLLVNACSQFIYTEKLYESSNEDCSEEKSSKVNQKDLRKDTKLVHTLRMAVEQTSDHQWLVKYCSCWFIYFSKLFIFTY